MGVHQNIGFGKFPKQGECLGERVEVCFGYDVKRMVGGVVVRDDYEDPYRTIIKLDDGRTILATECQYSLVAAPTEERRNG